MARDNGSSSAFDFAPTKPIDRHRLLSRLADCPRPVLWLTGPVGAGKSTLLKALAEKTAGVAIVHRCNNQEQHAIKVLDELRHGIESRTAGQKVSLPCWPDNDNVSLENYAGQLLTAIGELDIGEWTLALDDYQLLADDCELHGLLAGLSTNLEEAGGRLVVASREDPPPQWAQALLERNVELYYQLHFDREELNRVVSGYRCFDDRSEGWQQALYEYTWGWPAGVILILERWRLEINSGLILSEIGSLAGANFFSTTVFGELPSSTQTLLLHSAVLPFVPAEAAADILKIPQAGKKLLDLCAIRLLTKRAAQIPESAGEIGEKYFAFHHQPMFHDFLRQQSTLGLSKKDRTELAQRAGRVLAEHREFSAAVHLLVEYECWPQLTTLILGNAIELIENGQISQLENAFSSVPSPLLDTNPDLLFWLGICETSLGQPNARAHLTSAYELYCEQHNLIGMAIAWRAVVDAIWLSWEGLDQLEGWIQEYDLHLHPKRKELPEQFQTGLIMSRFGILSFWEPGHPELPELEKRLAGHIHAPLPSQERALLFVKILYHFTYATGNRAEADFYLNAMRTLVQQASASTLDKILLHNFEAAYQYCFDGAPEPCYQHVDAALEMGEQSGILVWQSVSITHGLYMALGRGDIKRAEKYIRHFKRVIGINNAMHLAFDELFSGWLAMLKGRPSSATKHVDAGLMFLERNPVPLIRYFFLAGKAALLIQQQAWKQAWLELGKIRRYAQAARSNNFELMTRLLQALWCLKRGRPVRAKAFLQRGADIGIAQNIFVSPWITPGQLSTLMGFALSEGLDREYFSRWVILNQLEIPVEMAARDRWPWPIRIRTLGAMQVQAGGKLLEHDGRAQKRLREILGLLITAGPRGMPQAQLIEELWPDKDERKGHSNLTTSLSRLRTYLGGPDFIDASDTRVKINARTCIVDSWEFLANTAVMDDLNTEQLTTLEQSYGGDYCVVEQNSGQALILRGTLSNRYIQVAMQLGEALEHEKHYRQAIEIYRCTLDKAGAEEEIYRKLMYCNAKMGRLNEIHTIYAECGKALADKSESLISAQTTAYFQRLTNENAPSLVPANAE